MTAHANAFDSDDLGPAVVDWTAAHRLRSETIGQDFLIEVAWPIVPVVRGEKVPVVYVLDGNSNFAMTAQTNASAARSSSGGGSGSIPPPPRTFTGTLAEGRSTVITLSLERGISYRIKGECDRDCDDLDLKLRRGATLVGDDVEPDDTPMVFVSPSVAGT